MPISSARGLRFATIITILSLLLVTNAAGPAGSSANDVFSVEPTAPEGTGQRPWFVYSLQPGQIFQDSVDIKNFSDDDLTLILYSSDGTTIPGGGGFAPLREDQTPTGAGTWVTLPIDEITLAPNEGASVPFQIEIPIDAEPGDHAAVIVASDPVGAVGEPDPDNPINITIRNRVGSRIYVRVAGPLEPSLRVDDITIVHDRPLNPLADGTATILYTVSNTGNIRLSEDIQVKVKGIFGRTVETLEPRNFPDGLPGGIIVVTEVVTGLKPWEPLSAEVSAVAREASTSRTRTFYPIPWPTVFLLLLALVLFVAWLWVRRHRSDDETDDEGSLGSPDDDPGDVERELVGAGA